MKPPSPDPEPARALPGWTERQRLDALAATGLLDTAPEQEFDDLVRLAAEMLEMPIAAIHLVAASRQWAKSEIGMGTREMPREQSFCTHVVGSGSGMEVRDATRDPRFAGNPLVLGGANIRFYAGEPLMAGGLAMGTLCVLDTRARPQGLDERQRFALRTLAHQVESRIALRQALGERTLAEAFHRQVLDSPGDQAIISLTLDGKVTGWNRGAQAVLGWDGAAMMGHSLARIFTPEDLARGQMRHDMDEALATGRGTDERWHLRRDGGRFWAMGQLTVLRDGQGAPIGFVKLMRDETARHLARQAAVAETSQLDALVAAQSAAGRGGRDEQAIWQGVADAALRVVGHASGVAMERPDGQVLRAVAAGGLLQPGDRVPLAGSLSGACLAEGRALVCADTQADPRADAARARALGVGSAIVVPVPRGGAFVGVLKLVAPGTGAFGERDLALAQLLVGIVATGLSTLAEHRSQQALQDSEARFRHMAEAVPQVVWEADAEGRCRFVNRRWSEFTGRPVEEALQGAGWIAFVHPDDEATVLRAWEAAQGPGTFRCEYRYRTVSGEYRWVLDVGAAQQDGQGMAERRWFGGMVDVHAERAEREGTERLAALLEVRVAERTRERDQIWQTSSDLLCVADLEGRFVSLNPAWTATLGWGIAEMLAWPFLELVHPEDQEATRVVLQGLRAREAQRAFVNRYRHRDGSYRFLSWSAVPRDGRIYATVRDITAERDGAEALRVAGEALRQSQKMEAVGQLTGGLAHDFNNLLAGIVGSLELMGIRIAQGRTAELGRYIEGAQGAANRAAALTHRLLAFSRRQTLDPRPIAASRLVDDMAELVRRTVGPAITLDVVTTPGLWVTLCDPNQLENALLNLCINARDAMPDGGRLTIETANATLGRAAAAASDLSPGEYVVLRVRDTGSGMSPTVMARVFDPFFTTKPIGQGTGLGLSMVYGFAAQSGGRARVRSMPGQGTTVTLYLPRHHGAPAEAASPAPASSLAAPPARGTVLVVDDEATVRLLMAELVQDLGYDVLEAADGGSALEVLASAGVVDLLVTDVGLPGGMNGRQLADAAQVRRPGLRVLFVTGYAEGAALGQGEVAPGMQVMTKPFSLEAMGERIRAMLAVEEPGV